MGERRIGRLKKIKGRLGYLKRIKGRIGHIKRLKDGGKSEN
jgi:hypothetical protein